MINPHLDHHTSEKLFIPGEIPVGKRRHDAKLRGFAIRLCLSQIRFGDSEVAVSLVLPFRPTAKTSTIQQDAIVLLWQALVTYYTGGMESLGKKNFHRTAYHLADAGSFHRQPTFHKQPLCSFGDLHFFRQNMIC